MQTSSPKVIRLRRSDPSPRQSISIESPLRATPSFTPPVAPPPQSVPEQNTPPLANPPVEKKVWVAEHPLAQHALMALRNKLTAAAEFRRYSEQLLLLLSIESLRTLPTRDDMVQTHSTTHTGPVLAKPVVFLSVSRHALGLVHKAAEIIPHLQVGSISLDRSSDSMNVEPRLHLANAPALGDVRVVLFIPVVASGTSASQALKFLRKAGVTDITLLSFLVSFQGLSRLQTGTPELKVWTAAIDSDWDSKRGPLPGLGNFGERLYA